MCERNTTDERDRAAKLFASLSKAHPYLVDHASHIDGEFNNALHDLRRLVDRLNAERDARPDERAVREAIRDALSKLAALTWVQVRPHGTPESIDQKVLRFRDFEYPAIPAPIPPCPLSGGREVRWDGGLCEVRFVGTERAMYYTRKEVVRLASEYSDLRTLADWLDSLPENNA